MLIHYLLHVTMATFKNKDEYRIGIPSSGEREMSMPKLVFLETRLN